MRLTKKKIISLSLCIIMLFFALAIPASARASAYFSYTNVFAEDIGNGIISIKVHVLGTGTMQQIGASQVIVYEEQPDGSYEPVATYVKETYDPPLISYNRASHLSYVTHYGTPGKSYYALCAFYAKNINGSQIKWSISNET